MQKSQRLRHNTQTLTVIPAWKSIVNIAICWTQVMNHDSCSKFLLGEKYKEESLMWKIKFIFRETRKQALFFSLLCLWPSLRPLSFAQCVENLYTVWPQGGSQLFSQKRLAEWIQLQGLSKLLTIEIPKKDTIIWMRRISHSESHQACLS